ncbi:ribosome biogenesis ATPase RIX7 [Thraustotheca clavata]|uniref:Ribosome biogenesis ATPase RIX7 n=1 Tax=Thraustotheca clavata TaxID=74557 RepID=A0A1W0ACE8_9STRA|nr:ribosome biogenesis ATPase RIX7 [Thraustotheca clavata]
MEAKVNFHVRKYLRENEDIKPTESTVLQHLLSTYSEYARKPHGPLKKMVQKAIAKNQPKNESAKRPRSDSDDEDEKQAQALEAQRPAANLLNNSITKAYAEVAKTEKEENKPDKPKKVKRTRPESAAVTNDNFIVSRPTTRYSDVGGIQAILKEVQELIEYPLTHPEIYTHLGVEPPRGILLHGPPGTGKTMLANAIAGESGACFLKVSAPEIVSGMSGESEQKVRDLFDQAIANAPSIIFIDEIDAITPKRENSSRGMEKRIVAQLLTSTDTLSLENTNGKPVLVIGATNRPNDLDQALRRAGRFDREICLGIPDAEAREKILCVLASKMRLAGDIDFKDLARRTPGYVGADLVSLTKEAAVLAVNRVFTTLLTDTPKPDAEQASINDEIRSFAPFTQEQLEPLSVCMEDFLLAVPKVQPSSKREGFATIPDVTWKDVGALVEVRAELVLSILHPLQHPERFEALGLTMPAGVLLYGPPGCGKTMLAKAIANESGANFISVKGPELLDKYVGESERAVRQVFERARASSPCIVFFDELDALCPRRGMSDGGNGVSERVVNQLLTEMDGLDTRKNVVVIAATNRPDIIDPAMLRPGRLDKLLYVPLPQASDRFQILTTLSKKCKLDPSLDLQQIAADPRCESFSGADLSALVREAGVAVLREADQTHQDTGLCIQMKHFNTAFLTVFPSVSKADQKIFEKMKKNLRKSRATLTNNTEEAKADEPSPVDATMA